MESHVGNVCEHLLTWCLLYFKFVRLADVCDMAIVFGIRIV